MKVLLVFALLGGAAACGAASDQPSLRRADAARDSVAAMRADSIARARQDSINRAQPGYIVDSILPIEEEVRRFKAAVGGPAATALVGGASSRDALMAAFASALSANDASALRAMVLSPREFIDLVYPSSPYTKPPYRQSPGLLWSQIQLPSNTGLRRLRERLGGKSLRLEGLTCRKAPEVQGENRLYIDCVVRFASGDAATRAGRLFGTIIERGGHFKFVSYANMY